MEYGTGLYNTYKDFDDGDFENYIWGDRYKSMPDARLSFRVPRILMRPFRGKDKRARWEIKIPDEALEKLGIKKKCDESWIAWAVMKNQVTEDEFNPETYNQIIDIKRCKSGINVYERYVCNGQQIKIPEGYESIIMPDELKKIYEEYNTLIFNCPHCDKVIRAYDTFPANIKNRLYGKYYKIPQKCKDGTISYRTGSIAEDFDEDFK